MKEIESKPILLLVDGHSLAFRSFYAFSKGGEGGLTTKEGIPTSVTFGFLKSLLENCKSLSPQGVTIAFDTPEPTFRHKTDPNYKANRDVAPEKFFQDLEQLQGILFNHLNLSLCSAPGYEADDVLGTLAIQASKKGWAVRILSGDRDLFQLVDDKKDIAILYMGGGPYAKSSNPLLIDEKGVKAKLGVRPDEVIELKALTGDSSDNIPGVKGVGPKTAINLLKENGSLDGVYSSLEELEGKEEKAAKGVIKGALKEKLKSNKSNAYLSKLLAEILIEIPIEKPPRLELLKVDREGLEKSLIELELHSLARQIEAFEETFSSGGFKLNNTANKNHNASKTKEKEESFNSIKTQGSIHIKPRIITSASQLSDLIELLKTFRDPSIPIAFDTETTDLNPFKAELVGIGFCWGSKENELAYIPIAHKQKNTGKGESTVKQIDLEIILSSLKPWLENPGYPKVLQNTKFDRLILLRHGVSLEGVIFDTLLADYINNSNNRHSLSEISKRELNFTPPSFKDVLGKNENFAYVDIKEASHYCGMDVYLTRKIYQILKDRLEHMGEEIIYLLREVEQPLEKVLAEMESTGISIDIEYLKKLSKEITIKLKGIEENVHLEANTKFNLSSPKQLGEILFETLKLDRKKSKRTKTGWSTNINVLEKLEEDHPIVSEIIEYRTLSKLLSTYVDALPELVEEETQRIHTDFNQAITTTGRLSSSNPNLQNIPIRTEFSRRIRKAFLPNKGWKLLSADYSQIELRILAHLSGENILQEAYQNGEDVHALTAKLLLNKDSINSTERRLGKTINFGVIYGMGAQRFARATGVSQSEAKEFLSLYKKKYPNVFSFLEKQERLALSTGYVKTLLGRRRYFEFDKNGLGRLLGKNPEEIDLNSARRAGIEAQQLRAAANAPIQGSSADIIKIAMIDLHKQLKASELPAQLLLQVHDELLIEVEPKVLEEVKLMTIKTMENAVKLNVPLLVEIGVGETWMDAK